MAGQTPGRRQWRVPREPIENIQSLGLAEDGCPESQVILAKHLLEDSCDDRSNQEEKARLGVYWLIKASEKGHEEATRMLQNCLESGRGISEHNVDDVRACLNMSIGEKVSREAARELFLRLSQGEDFVTSGQIFEEMKRCSRESPNSDSDSDSLTDSSKDWSLREEGSGEKLTEEMLVSAASTHCQGVMPVALRRGPAAASASTAPPPGAAAAGGGSTLLDLAVSRLASLPVLPSPLLLLALLSFFSIETLLESGPTLIYYTSLFIMLLTTCQVLTKKWEFNEFRQWSNLLVRWGCPESNSVEAQWSHCLRNAKPCLLFFPALLLNLLSSSFVSSLPYSEITVLSTIVSLLILYNFAWYNKKLDFLVIISFVIHLLARYPYEIDTVVSQYWRYLDVHTPTFASYIVGNSIEFCLNFRVVFYLLMPALLVKMGARDRWLGVFTVLLPHLVSLAWWQMAVFASNGMTQYGMIRSCLAVVGMVLFLPLAGFITVVIPVGALARFVSTHQVSPPLALAAASLITLIYMGTKSRRAGKLFTWIQGGLCLVSVYMLLSWTGEGGGGGGLTEIGLDWTEYLRVCRAGPGEAPREGRRGGEEILASEACSSLTGVRVSWEGRVISTRLASLHNPIQPFVNKLPLGLQEIVTCMWGERFDDCSQNEKCTIPSSLAHRCHLANWNKYEYEIEVELGSDDAWGSAKTTALLTGDTNFRNFSLFLEHGDKVWFSGRLSGTGTEHGSLRRQGKPRAEVSLLKADCLSCEPRLRAPPSSSLTSSNLLKTLFNFIFTPMAVIR